MNCRIFYKHFVKRDENLAFSEKVRDFVHRKTFDCTTLKNRIALQCIGDHEDQLQRLITD